MSSAEGFYSSSPTPGVYAATPPPNIHKAEPPPPPPPKPGSHEVSRQNTPFQTGPPLPPIPSQGQYSPGPESPGLSTPAPPPHPSQYHAQAHRQSTQQIEPEIRPPTASENWLPEAVLNKNTADIAPILSNPELLSSLATLHPSFASSHKPLSNQLSSNLALNDRVRDTANHLTQLRDQTQALLLHHSNLSTQWRKKQTEMDKALEPWSPKAMYQRLVAGIAEQEAVVRAVEESFLEGSSRASGLGKEDFYGSGHNAGHGAGKASDREVGEWVRRIRDEVQTLEMRKEMRERWDEGRVGGWR